MKINDEAVEEAAKVLCEQMWENAHERQRAYAREEARDALEAAAPYLMAQAWDEGCGAGWNDCLLDLQNGGAKASPNPYR